VELVLELCGRWPVLSCKFEKLKDDFNARPIKYVEHIATYCPQHVAHVCYSSCTFKQHFLLYCNRVTTPVVKHAGYSNVSYCVFLFDYTKIKEEQDLLTETTPCSMMSESLTTE